MPREIKTKSATKNIKVLDKAANVGQRMKSAFIRSKDAIQSADRAADDTQRTGYETPESYATDKVSSGAQSTARGTARRLSNPHKKASENFNKAKEQFKRARQQLPRTRKQAADKAKQTADIAKNTASTLKSKAEQAQKVSQTAQKSVSDAKQVLQQTRQAGRQTVQAAKQGVKTTRQTEQTVKTAGKTAKTTAKGTIKTVKKSVKTAERTAKTTVKTAQKTAKTAQQSAKTAAKAAKIAAKASREAAKAAVQTAKAAVRVTIAMVKAAIAAIKGLVALIAAGGWVAVLVILIICMIGLLVGSILGIFFSGEDSGSGYTMPMAIREINQEYADRLTEIRNGNAHDDVQMSGTRAAWKEVLAIYAVKTSTDPENAQDVATMDEEKKELLSSVFWDMNIVTYRTETKEVTEVTVEGDGEDFITTETTVTKTILYITISHKTADEMAEQYHFTDKQKAQLAELLSDQYADLWNAVLYGIHNGSGDIVEMAISQIGNVNGEPYWSWYGFESRVAWCACFVSWCANECGYIESGIIPSFAWCPAGVQWFKDRDIWQTPGYVPAPGDIIFFDWEQDGNTDHVGIVEYVEGDYVHTVEGNTSNSVARRTYRLDSSVIFGFGTPLYN